MTSSSVALIADGFVGDAQVFLSRGAREDMAEKRVVQGVTLDALALNAEGILARKSGERFVVSHPLLPLAVGGRVWGIEDIIKIDVLNVF